MTNKSREDWVQIIEEQKQSGQTKQAYCKEKGINPTYFSTRKKQLENTGIEKPNNAFITLKHSHVETNNSSLKLNIANSHLHFAALPPIHWLSQLLKAVQA
jgi:hypothetical protein